MTTSLSFNEGKGVFLVLLLVIATQLSLHPVDSAFAPSVFKNVLQHPSNEVRKSYFKILSLVRILRKYNTICVKFEQRNFKQH